MSAFSTPARTRFTVQHFHRMGEAGIFGENDRIELIEGELIDMAPIGSRHAFAADELPMRFARLLGEEARVSTQNPLILGEHSEPQPDLMLLRPRPDSCGRALPGPHDVLLVVGVADSTLDYDRSIEDLCMRGTAFQKSESLLSRPGVSKSIGSRRPRDIEHTSRSDRNPVHHPPRIPT